MNQCFILLVLGLYDEKDISFKGVEALKKVDAVYAEFYTAKLFGGSISSLEDMIGNEIKILTREEVEEENLPLKEAKIKDVAFLSAGDPLIATTHSEMLIEAKKRNKNYCNPFFINSFCCTRNSWSSGI